MLFVRRAWIKRQQPSSREDSTFRHDGRASENMCVTMASVLPALLLLCCPLTSATILTQHGGQYTSSTSIFVYFMFLVVVVSFSLFSPLPLPLLFFRVGVRIAEIGSLLGSRVK